MEAKDTVMSKAQVNKILKEKGSSIPSWVKYDENHPEYKMCLAQAEISFKAGIREVVEFVNEQTFADPRIGVKEEFMNIKISPTYWQAKPKEWGIE